MIESECVCYYCLKRKQGICGLMSNKVKRCKKFSYFGEINHVRVSLRAAKRLDELINKPNVKEVSYG